MVHAGAGATDRRAQSRDAGQCAAASLRQAVGRRRRAAARHRAPPRQGDQRADYRRQERRNASQAGPAIFRARGEEALRGAGAWLARERPRHHQCRDQPRCGAARSHDHPRQRRSRGDYSLRSPRAHRLAIWQVRAGGRSHRDRTHSSDPRAHVVDWPSGSGRLAVSRAEGTAPAHCLAKSAVQRRPPRASQAEAGQTPAVLALNRNFLHAAAVEFTHPRSGEPLSFSAPLPPELAQLLEQIRG